MCVQNGAMYQYDTFAVHQVHLFATNHVHRKWHVQVTFTNLGGLQRKLQ